MKIGEKTFNAEDQAAFARASLDTNPVHMDAVAARRLVTGRPVVHGIHVLLTALEFSRDDVFPGVPGAISCTFGNPVSVGDSAVFSQSVSDEGSVVIEVTVADLPCARISLSGRRTALRDASPSGAADPMEGREERIAAGLTVPLDEAADLHLKRKYIVTPLTADLVSRFPRACRLLGESALGGVAALSYFVGMVCPGLNSLFSSVDFETGRGDCGANLVLLVRKFDKRIGLFDVEFRGCIDGSLKAFLRPAPQPQPSLHELSALVAPGEFRGSRSLVIGGSRGLGECAAKLLAAGGGEVTITYASGQADAERICDEIRGSGGVCRAVKLDLTTDALEALSAGDYAWDAVYFFATPRIYRKKTGAFNADLFREFCDFYLCRFHELCAYLERRSTGRKTRVYLPSSVFVTERPRGLTEYAMAKAAAEVLAEDINRHFRNVSVLVTRLPRLTTDQTSSIMKLSTGSNAEALLPVIRELRG